MTLMTEHLMPLEFVRSRPEVQRQDIGPMVNDIALEIYARAPEQWAAEKCYEQFVRPIAFRQMHLLADSLILPLDTMAYDLAEIRQTEALLTCIDTPSSLIGEVSNDEQTTHYPNVAHVLEEGLSSGVVMPLSAYRHVVAARNAKAKGVDFRVEDEDLDMEQIDLKDMAATLRSTTFQSTLLRLAHAPNGTYGTFSSRTSGLKEYDKNSLYGPNAGQTLAVEDDGRLSLTENAQEELKRRRTKDSDRSAGCPVRYTTYPVLGRFARSYAEENKINEEALKHPGKSAIVAGCEYIANCVEKINEYIQTTQSEEPLP
jgi:hypothetical protein